MSTTKMTEEEAHFIMREDRARMERHTSEYASVRPEPGENEPIDPTLLAVLANCKDMASKLKLGRWMYCKYCYKNVLPRIGPDYSIVICSECEAGLDLVERLYSEL